MLSSWGGAIIEALPLIRSPKGFYWHVFLSEALDHPRASNKENTVISLFFGLPLIHNTKKFTLPPPLSNDFWILSYDDVIIFLLSDLWPPSATKSSVVIR
jgi:hypothetical protein